jgi:hypothetical protein
MRGARTARLPAGRRWQYNTPLALCATYWPLDVTTLRTSASGARRVDSSRSDRAQIFTVPFLREVYCDLLRLRKPMRRL